MEQVVTFQFLRPWLLLLLIFPLLMFWKAIREKDTKSSWEKVCDKKLLQYLLIKNKDSAHKLKQFLINSALIIAVLSAAGPSWRQKQDMRLFNETPVFVLLDLSSDMNKEDNLIRAKIEMTDFLSAMTDFETGLIVYSAEPFVVSPLSTDVNLITNLLPALNTDIMPTNGNRVDRAIDLAVERIKNAGYAKGNIVIFSTGTGESFNQAASAAKRALESGIKVSAINVSNKSQDSLLKIASIGDGIFVEKENNLSHITSQISAKPSAILDTNANKLYSRADDGYYLLFLPLLCCLYFFRKGALVVLLILSWGVRAEAGFWLSDNVLAQKMFEDKKFDEAAEKFQNQEWKGASYYRAGNYQKALEAFSEGEDNEMRYNYANALAKSGQTEEAIKVYEQVLEKDPNHEDARFNLEYIKKMQESPQQNQMATAGGEKQELSQSSENQEDGDEVDKEKFTGEDKGSEKEESEDSKAQNGGSNQIDKKTQEKESQQDENQEQNEASDMTAEQKEEHPFQAKESSKNENYSETAQAREQVYRQIPEDKGGLLRAFIRREYLKNRYGE